MVKLIFLLLLTTYGANALAECPPLSFPAEVNIRGLFFRNPTFKITVSTKNPSAEDEVLMKIKKESIRKYQWVDSQGNIVAIAKKIFSPSKKKLKSLTAKKTT